LSNTDMFYYLTYIDNGTPHFNVVDVIGK